MSLTLQNDFARRLRYGGSRQAMIASALFGRSCRLLEPPAATVERTPRPVRSSPDSATDTAAIPSRPEFADGEARRKRSGVLDANGQ
jgi:hypothetical protein